MADTPNPPPGYISTPVIAPLYVDGLPLDTARQALISRTPLGSQTVDSQRFWASPPRPLDDDTPETLIVKLSKPKLINYLAFDLSHLPAHWYFHYWDAKKKDWVEILGPNSYVLRIYITDSIPQVIGPVNVLQADQHPSHYGAQHWQHYELDCKPFTTSMIQISGNRGFGARSGPVDPFGRPAAYSLGVRNLDFGYEILNKSQVPLTDRKPDIVTERESFTTVTDILGSPVELSVRENRASDLLLGKPWRCEPQPFSYAVVNLYVDARDSAGDPQVIDRFYIDPITSGVRCNLYYSEQAPQPDSFTASDSPFPFPLARTGGSIDPSIDGGGLLFPDQISYLDLDNQAIQWDPNRPWWLAVDIQPQFNAEELDDHVIWDAGAFQLMWQTQQWTLGFDGGQITLESGDFSYNERLQFVVAYDGQSLTFHMAGGGFVTVPASFKNVSVTSLRFGAEAGSSAEDFIVTGAYRLRALVLKQESITFASGDPLTGVMGLIVPDPVQAFLADTTGYVQKPQFEADDNGSTTNALLRFAPNFAFGASNPWGFLGGPGDVYADLVWTPVNRDFVVAKGYMTFNPTRASVFKLEFTNLQPQPYDVYKPVTRTVQTFPASVVAESVPTPPTGPTNVLSPGLQANHDSAHPYTYADAIRLLYAAAPSSSTSAVSPTEALVATDPATAQRLSSFGSLYSFQPWQPPATAPRFTRTAQHYYETIDVLHNTQVAYFVALSGLQMYRVDYTADDDTEQYLETFADTKHIDNEQLIAQNVQPTTNYVTNPSFELDSNSDGMPDSYTLLKQGSVTGSVTRITTDQLYGNASLQISATSLGPASTDRLGVSFNPTGMDLTAPVAFSVYTKVTQGNPTIRVYVEYYNASNVFILSNSITQSGVGTTWQRIEGVFQPPILTDHIKAYVWAEAGGGQAVTVHIDGLQIEQTAVSPYCDGDQPGCEWMGAASTSASQRIGIVTSPWVWSPGMLSTPPNLADPAVASSQVLASQRKVRGLQFATQQSAPVQLLLDPDFDDPELRAWTGLGDIAPLALSQDFNSSIGSTVQISRQANVSTWETLEAEWSSWDDLENSDPSPISPDWDDMEGDSIESSYGGLRYTASVQTTKAGRIYAAARVYSETALNEPLLLQIITPDGTVLAEAEQDVSGGHITEWYAAYTIGDDDVSALTTWADIENRDPSPALPAWNDMELFTWDGIDTTVERPDTQLSVQLIQRGATDDTFYIDTLSLFEDAIVWEFSNDGGDTWWQVFDIRNDPHGVFIFPDPATPTPSSGTQLMWRVTGYRPGLHVNSLAIRPWYGSLPLGVPHKEPGTGGPNIQPTDHYGPVTQDPRWQTWHDPIPQDWYFRYRRLLALEHVSVQVDTTTQAQKADVYLNPHALVLLPPEEPSTPPPPPVTLVDIYSDAYPDTYGVTSGGDTYTDTYNTDTY